MLHITTSIIDIHRLPWCDSSCTRARADVHGGLKRLTGLHVCDCVCVCSLAYVVAHPYVRVLGRISHGLARSQLPPKCKTPCLATIHGSSKRPRTTQNCKTWCLTTSHGERPESDRTKCTALCLATTRVHCLAARAALTPKWLEMCPMA